MFFSIPNNQSYNNPYSLYDSSSSSSEEMYSYSTSPTVDCTLSLGTPSTRLGSSNTISDRSYYDHHQKQTTNPLHLNGDNGSHNMTNFCWDFIQSAKQIPNNSHKSSNRGGNNNHNNSDSLLARRCANCDTTSTPLWRNGPRGPKSLCNACGIRFKKEERRASAASTNYNGGGAMESSQEMSGHYYDNNNPSSRIHHSNSQKTMPCFSPALANEFRFIEDNDHHHHHHSESNGISFLSWRLNVNDRPGLLHDFTR